jgi:hypothetical protein
MYFHVAGQSGFLFDKIYIPKFAVRFAFIVTLFRVLSGSVRTKFIHGHYTMCSESRCALIKGVPQLKEP